MTEPFKITSPYLTRLKFVLFIIGVFFILGMLSVYLSSQGFLKSLQRINSSNNVINSISITIDGLNSSEEITQKATLSTNPNDQVFVENLKLVKLQFNSALAYTNDQKTIGILNRGLADVLEYEQATKKLFQDLKKSSSPRIATELEVIKAEVAAAQQFLNDSRDSLREAQLILKKQNEELFTSVYKNRFLPLKVAGLFSVIFFTFVLVVGFQSTRRLARSFSNLLKATDEVSQGHLNHQAPVLMQDELGRVTHEFNLMVKSLSYNRDTLELTLSRITRLQSITAAFSQALTTDQVLNVIFNEAFHAMGVTSGAVGILDKENNEIELRKAEGYNQLDIDKWKRFPLNSSIPMADAVRTGVPIFLESFDELKKRYPLAILPNHEPIKSFAALPLMVGGEIIGALQFRFQESRAFLQEEKEFLTSLAQQCSQSIKRTQLYEEAQSAIRVRDEFLSIASHELRTPLTALKLKNQIFFRKLKKSDEPSMPVNESIRNTEAIDLQLNRLTRLIDDLLDVSRITSGKLTLNLDLVNVGNCIEEVCAHYHQQLIETNFNVVLDLDETLICCLDKLRFEQVITNLLTNASKYAPGKPIQVSSKRNGNMAEIVVSDQGPGISSENIKRIFERFERVKDRGNVGGLGLGLYISKQIIDAHEGRIEVESVVGLGSKFKIELPLHQS